MARVDLTDAILWGIIGFYAAIGAALVMFLVIFR